MNKLKKKFKMNTKRAPMDVDKEFKLESCRICLTPNDKMSNIFARTLLTKIEYCTGIKIKKEDGLPTKICKSCQTSLTVAHKFKKLCLLTEQICRNVLETNIKTEQNHDASKIVNNNSNEDYLNDGWLKQDQSNNNFNGDCLKKDNLNENCIKKDNFNENRVKGDRSNDNFNENCVTNDHSEDKLNEKYLDNDYFKENFNGDKINDNSDNVLNDVSDQDNGITIIKEEIECEYEESTEDVPKEIINSIDRPRRMPKPRFNKDAIGNTKNDRKKRGPYRKKTEAPKRRRKFKYFQLFCETCQIKFTCKKDSDEHRDTVHKETWSAICEVCGKLFASRGAYSSHVRYHLPPSFFCEHCDYRSSYRWDLVKHLLIHTGIKQYQCSQCPNNYYTVSNLREHERVVHERVLRYACDVCGKMFYDRTHLRRHVDSHSDIKRFECDVCHSAFTRRCHWKKHLLKQHGIIIPAQRPGRVRVGATGDSLAPDAADAVRRLRINHI